MKTVFKVLGSIGVLGAVILLIFHLVLLYGLTSAMREVVLPQVKEETGLDVQVGRLSINAASGLLFLNHVEVKNPQGFLLENLLEIERLELELDIPSLFKKKPYRVKNVELQSGQINIVRDLDGDINIDQLRREKPKAGPSSDEKKPVAKDGKPPSGKGPKAGKPAPSKPPKPWPEVLIEKLLCHVSIRYVDMKLEQLDLSLIAKVEGGGLSSLHDPDAPWSDLSLLGALESDRTRFVTDLDLKLAPLAEAQEPSFDLTGKMLEIDPRLMGEIYESLNVRSDPFGINPDFHCRFGQFHKSQVGIVLRNIQFKDGLIRDLVGLGAIDSLRLVVPVEGTLKKPLIDVEEAFESSVRNNAGTILDAFRKRPAQKDLATGDASVKNTPSSIDTDAVVDLLGDEIKDLAEDEELKEDLKELGKWLYGK
ncbi:MAG: hypothetical protein OES84_04370 [Kiritimatiellaceae bacterium]|nr:hypothetical protein [Kiritimatiellaceae bacterium]